MNFSDVPIILFIMPDEIILLLDGEEVIGRQNENPREPIVI